MTKKNKSEQLYGIIGLGRFGFALAQELALAGKDIIVLDKDEEKVKAAASFTDNAFVIGSLTAENLRHAGIQNCDTVVICIGEKIDVSILTTLTVIRFGVPHVIAKAMSDEQGSVLETLGAEVVFPERNMAVRVAQKLLAPNVLEYISLSDEIDIIEIKLSERINNKTVLELDLRKKFGLNIIAVRKADNIIIEIEPTLMLSATDTITVVGKKANIRRFEAYLSK
ncbi:MAG: TrkA family potassium uptake protein [Clostridia bacterium]|nr:TrkA family potassium uptake protein [Clostridia bacterium]